VRELIEDPSILELLRKFISSRLRRDRDYTNRRIDVDVEDVLHETIVKALTNESSFHPERGGRGWLVRIASHLIYEHGRERKRESRARAILRREADQTEKARIRGALHEVRSNEGSILDCLRGSEADSANQRCRDLLRELIDHLKPKHRQAITLSYLDNLHGRELAKALAVDTVGAARALKHRAMEELRGELSTLQVRSR
jgi:RNA polymerase sigma factor (sigma-70 family)